MLDKHRSPISKPLETDRLARYILSLGALCKDPRRFYGHDLITLLQHHEPTEDDEFALATLAACSSATHVRKRQIRRLLDIASGEITNVGKNWMLTCSALHFLTQILIQTQWQWFCWRCVASSPTTATGTCNTSSEGRRWVWRDCKGLAAVSARCVVRPWPCKRSRTCNSTALRHTTARPPRNGFSTGREATAGGLKSPCRTARTRQ